MFRNFAELSNALRIYMVWMGLLPSWKKGFCGNFTGGTLSISKSKCLF